jgi:hypothetical protein
LHQAESNPIRHFENIPAKLLKKIVIGDFQPTLVHRQVPSIYDSQHNGGDGKVWERRKNEFAQFKAGCGGARYAWFLCQSYPKAATIHRRF